MENSDARSVRRVRCPRCHCVLEEPGAPVYQCGGCGTTLRAKNRTGTGAGDAARASPSRSGLPPQSRHLDASDVASTSRSSTPTPPHVGSTSRSGTPTTPHVASTSRSGTPTLPEVGTSWHRATDATGSRHGSGDLALVSAGTRGSGDVASTSSTPDATASSRRQGTDATSRRESGGLVSAARSRGSGDVASTSSTPDANAIAGSGRPGADTTSRGESGGPVPARNRVSEQLALIEKREREQSAASQEVRDDSEGCGPRDAGGAEPGVGIARFSGGNKDASPELQDDTDKGMKRQAESTDAARKKHSGEAAVQPQYHHDRRQELAPKSSAQPAAAQPAREENVDDDAGREKAPSPSRHEIQVEHLGPLRKKILKTVDELKGDLSELFSKSPELNQPRARPARLPKQEGYVSRAAAASGFPARARHAAATTDGHRGHHGSAARALKPRQAAAPPRGLPSRRYHQCRAHPCCCNVEPRPCQHGCCRHHGKPECSSCRGYCCRPRAQEPSAPRKPPAGKEPKRRLPPRNHCRPVLKGAPFIVCSSCFKLVQVPADFAVSTKTVRKLRCGSCSTVLSYSYRDPARKKAYQDSVDRCSTDGSELHGGKGDERSDPFAPFIDAFGLSSYSTEDEQRLPVSRNTSFDTLDGTKAVGRLHRLMGYGSASELLRHSPDLYESFSERTTPDVRQHDTKGKGVCIDDDDDDYDVDDSDEEDVGALKRSVGKGSGWQLPWMPGKGTPAAGAIRIK
ncbi:protein ENHANCED DISEASE RESISTANCE 4-like [Miscanthus floridulus]|uniref:protein ENHANCED DISEASE RESISTANCE 4-like n=1 Tax=Miscanthus floridulus TaxID=154761 RepID=UPI003459A8BB